MPNSLIHFPVFRLVPKEYLGRESSHLCVIRKTSHLSELKWSCHLDAQDTNWSTSNCKASLSLAMFDSSLYTLVSSANILTVEEMLNDISSTKKLGIKLGPGSYHGKPRRCTRPGWVGASNNHKLLAFGQKASKPTRSCDILIVNSRSWVKRFEKLNLIWRLFTQFTKAVT